VENEASSGTTLPPKVAAASRQKWRSYSLEEENIEETIKTAIRSIARAHTVEKASMTKEEIEKRKAFLREQAREIERKFKTSA